MGDDFQSPTNSGFQGRRNSGFQSWTTVPIEITVTPSPNTIVEGNTIQLTAESTDPNDSFTWVSESPPIASVDSNGLVTGESDLEFAGVPVQITITATGTNSGAEGTATVGVATAEISVIFSPPSPRIVGHTTTAIATSDDPLDTSFTWLSSNTSVATIHATTGAITTNAPGTTSISAVGSHSGETGVSVLTVSAATVIVLPNKITVIVGGTVDYSASSNDPLDSSYAWDTVLGHVVVNASTGEMKAKSPGLADVRAQGNHSLSTGIDEFTVVCVGHSVEPGGSGFIEGEEVTYTVTPSNDEVLYEYQLQGQFAAPGGWYSFANSWGYENWTITWLTRNTFKLRLDEHLGMTLFVRARPTVCPSNISEFINTG